jgi:hypothetical protein
MQQKPMMTNLSKTEGRVLRDYYRLGLVTDQRIHTTNDGYVLTFRVRGSKNIHALWKTRGETARSFASLDTLIDFLRTFEGLAPTTTIDLHQPITLA